MTFIMGIIFLLLFMALRKKGEEHMSHEDYQHLICIFLLPSSYSMIADLLACYHLNSDYLIETDKHNYFKGIIFDDFQYTLYRISFLLQFFDLPVHLWHCKQHFNKLTYSMLHIP